MTDQKRTQRNLNPTPEAVFAMWAWSARYAAQRGGSMDFWDSLDTHEQAFCRDALKAIAEAKGRS